jgi:uncharacterized membrane protein YdbT with pleckstrin-like domain
MALRDGNLIQDESVVLELREHAKAMTWPFVIFLALVAVAGGTLLVSPADVVTWAVLGVCLVVGVGWVFLPWLRWRTTSYSITTQRIAERRGILTRTGRDIPLYRVNDISIEEDLIDRVFGCGTLVVADATEKPGMVLHDVPHVEAVHKTLQELLWSTEEGAPRGHREVPQRSGDAS